MWESLEEKRYNHEKRDRIIKHMVSLYIGRPKNLRERIAVDYRLNGLLNEHRKTSAELLHLYEDTTKDINESNFMTSSVPKFELVKFYKRLYDIKQSYNQQTVKLPTISLEHLVDAASDFDDSVVFAKFTDEENFGQYIDLHEMHLQYNNIPGIMRIDYIAYLTEFDQLFDIPIESKRRKEYVTYVRSLVSYLEGFVRRTRPLFDVDSDLELVIVNFERSWLSGTFPGWKEMPANVDSRSEIDLSKFTTVQEVFRLGCKPLKLALQSLGLKCGGTQMELAQRMFATKLNHFDRPKRNINHTLASLEAQVYRYAELLVLQRYDTRDEVQRKQARRNFEMEDDGTIDVDEEEPDDEEGTPYNPKNLPVGYDGRPIPYWLYKLLGLNLKFVCEICGNFRYFGPRAFQQHFVEWRHVHGMRCLGIPNTAHFAGIILIEDALALWEQLKLAKSKDRWNADESEEFEDSKGNVLNRKLFMDLERQGVL